MAADDDPDLIRLEVPADAAFVALVEVTAAVLARRAGMSDAEARASRATLGGAFAELATGDPDDAVAVEVRVGPGRLVARLARGDAARTVTCP